MLYLLFSFYGVYQCSKQSHGLIFIGGGNFLGNFQQLLLLGGQAAVGKSPLVVGKSRNIVKADIVVFRQSYGTFKGNLVREEQIRAGYWQCTCGTLNPPYATSCSCGKRPRDITAEKAKEAVLEDEKELNNLKKLKEYKELLDAGVITQEEFEAKKAKLL